MSEAKNTSRQVSGIRYQEIQFSRSWTQFVLRVTTVACVISLHFTSLDNIDDARTDDACSRTDEVERRSTNDVR